VKACARILLISVLFWSGCSRTAPDAFVLLRGDHLTMSGSEADISRARALRKSGEDLLWVRKNGKDYVVRDKGVLDKIRQLYELQEELGRKQSELGKQQADLGSKQAALGTRQATEALRRPGQAQDIAKQQSELGAKQSNLGEQQSKLGQQQQELSQSAEKKLREIISGAVASGAAVPAQ
jgi:bla regulator protein blaR1